MNLDSFEEIKSFVENLENKQLNLREEIIKLSPDKIENQTVILFLLEKGCEIGDFYKGDDSVEILANIVHREHEKVLEKYLIDNHDSEIVTPVFFYHATNTNLLEYLYPYCDKNPDYFVDVIETLYFDDCNIDLVEYYTDKLLRQIDNNYIQNTEDDLFWDRLLYFFSLNGRIRMMERLFQKGIQNIIQYEMFLHKEEELDSFAIAAYNGRDDICKLLLNNGYSVKPNFVPNFSDQVTQNQRENIEKLLQ